MAASIIEHLTALPGSGIEVNTFEMGKHRAFLPSLASTRPSSVKSRSPVPRSIVTNQASTGTSTTIRPSPLSALETRHAVSPHISLSRAVGLTAVEDLIDGAVLFCFSAAPPQPSVQAFVTKSGLMSQETLKEILAPIDQQSGQQGVHESDRIPAFNSPDNGSLEHTSYQSDPLPQWINSFTTGLEGHLAALESAYRASEPGLLHHLEESLDHQAFPLELSPSPEAPFIGDRQSSESAAPPMESSEAVDSSVSTLATAPLPNVCLGNTVSAIGAVALAQLAGIVSIKDLIGTAGWMMSAICVRPAHFVLRALPAAGLLCAGLLVHSHRQAALKLVGLTSDEKSVEFQVSSLRTQCIWQVAAVVVLSAVLPVGATAALSGILI